MSNGYRIAHVHDFLKVPADRLPACLAEFFDYLEVARGVVKLAESCGGVLGMKSSSEIGAFIWIDDGRRDRSIVIETSVEIKKKQ